MKDKTPQLFFADRKAWRAWLEKHHGSADGIWMVYYKKHTGKKSIPYDDAVEEALCFGWVDSIVHRLDAERYVQKFTPRKEKSTWSKSNKERVQKLIKQGCMTPAGMAKIEAAKSNGSWDTLTDVDNLVVPDDLAAALKAEKEAAANFSKMSPSDRKMYLYWIAEAKTELTRTKRIRETVKRLAQNKKRTEPDRFVPN